MEDGVYEASIGLWPPTPGLRAELRVDNQPAMLVGGGTVEGANAFGLPPSNAARSDAIAYHARHPFDSSRFTRWPRLLRIDSRFALNSSQFDCQHSQPRAKPWFRK